MKSHVEIERKWDVAVDTPVPDLTQLPEIAAVESPAELTLTAVYFDTEQRDLMRAGITLRRRTGGEDDGWHLKLPRVAGEREELHEKLRRGSSGQVVPKSLRMLVQVHARRRTLVPVATLRNRRATHRLLAEDGTALAELCDDHVDAETPAEGAPAKTASWREWEVELLAGSPELLSAADAVLTAAGARPAVSTSKLARALDVPSQPSGAPVLQPTKKSSAGQVLQVHLRGLVEVLQQLDPKVRTDRPDSVHKMRVTTRRLRSALATFAPLLDAGSSVRLRAELRWLAGVLGEARDAEVMRDRLLSLAAAGDREEPASSGDGVRDGSHNLGAELEERYREAHELVLRGLGSARYYRLLDALDDLVASPPWTDAAGERAGNALRRLVLRDWKRLAKRARKVRKAASQAERDDALHEVRKAAKRLRYACEALSRLHGEDAADLGAAAKELQEVLGEHQDSVVAQELLRDLAERSVLDGEDTLVLGRLHVLEEQQAERSLAHFEAAWTAASRKRLRRWLR